MSKADIRLLVTDLDGTLIGSSAEFPLYATLSERIAGLRRDDGMKWAICTGRTIPWLQDTAGVDAWGAWEVANDDVVILDTENKKLEVYNLITHDLRTPTDYAELKALLKTYAGE